MSETAPSLAPVTDEAIRDYISQNRARLAGDASLLSLLLPERFVEAGIHDLQRAMIEKLRGENAALKAKLEAVERAVKAWGSPPKS